MLSMIRLRSAHTLFPLPPYSGPATLTVQHKDGRVASYPIMVGSDGTYRKSIALSPEDQVQAHVYRPKDNNPQELFVGQTAWIFPKIPYEDIVIHADAFNDRITGTVGGAYNGTVEIVIRDTEGSADDRIYLVQARAGEFSLSADLVGTDGVSAWSFCEGVRLPQGDYMVAPDLNSLEIDCTNSQHDQLVGTVVNTAANPSGPYIGDVYLAPPGSLEILGIARTVASSDTGGELVKSVATRSLHKRNTASEFMFDAVPLVLDLGYSVWIEHEGLRKFFTYDLLEEVGQEAKKPMELAVASPLTNIINPVVNPVQQALSLQQSNVAQIGQDSASYGASAMQMMAPSASHRFSWEGAWETSNGPLVLNQSGEIVRGIYSDERYLIHGKVSDSRLIGMVDEGDGLLGAVDLTPTSDGRAFTGTVRYAGELDAQIWAGILVSQLEHKGIVSNPKSLEGVWATDCGVLVLDATSNRYFGVFGVDRQEIEATFANGVLQGEIRNDKTEVFGTMRLSFDRSRTSFTGYYRYAGDEDMTPWEGWRLF